MPTSCSNACTYLSGCCESACMPAAALLLHKPAHRVFKLSRKSHTCLFYIYSGFREVLPQTFMKQLFMRTACLLGCGLLFVACFHENSHCLSCTSLECLQLSQCCSKNDTHQANAPSPVPPSSCHASQASHGGLLKGADLRRRTRRNL